MNCPYCGEEIKRDAILCRHCHRDLNFLAPVMKRLKAMEETVDNLAGRVKRLERRPAPVPRAVPAGNGQSRSLVPFVVAAVVAGIIVGVANYAWWDAPSGSGIETVLEFVFVGTGPLTALILGILRQHRRTLGGVMIGLTVGAAYSIGEAIAVFVTLDEVFAALAVALVMAVPAVWFGGWIGDVTVRRIDSPFRGLHTAIAQDAPADAGPGRPPLSERFARVVEAATPLVTAVVPIVMIILQLLYGGTNRQADLVASEKGGAPVEQGTGNR